MDEKTTPELQVGDIVLTYGMRVLLDQPGHDIEPRWPGEQQRYFDGLVLNPDERSPRVPASWLYLHPASRTGEPRWTIKGNELAKWTVET